MILAHPDFSFVLRMDENAVGVVVLESQAAFRRYVRELSAQIDGEAGRFVLSDDGATLSMEDCCALVADPLSLDMNDRRAASALTKWLKAEAVSERMYERTQQMKWAVLSWMGALADQSEYPLQFTREPELAQIWKSVDAAFLDDAQSDLERLTNYLKIRQDFLRCKCALFVNLKRFFGPEDREQLYRFAAYRKLHLILIENVEQRDLPQWERTYVVDRDGCEIYADDV